MQTFKNRDVTQESSLRSARGIPDLSGFNNREDVALYWQRYGGVVADFEGVSQHSKVELAQNCRERNLQLEHGQLGSKT